MKMKGMTKDKIVTQIKSLINANYIFLKKIPNNRDITTLLNDFSINVDKTKLLAEYKKCTEDHVLGFMLIDINAPDDQRFRCGFKQIIKFNKLDNKNISEK
jgi:hypothetical protein